jgi:hypothetical protein
MYTIYKYNIILHGPYFCFSGHVRIWEDSRTSGSCVSKWYIKVRIRWFVYAWHISGVSISKHPIEIKKYICILLDNNHRLYGF